MRSICDLLIVAYPRCKLRMSGLHLKLEKHAIWNTCFACYRWGGIRMLNPLWILQEARFYRRADFVLIHASIWKKSGSKFWRCSRLSWLQQNHWRILWFSVTYQMGVEWGVLSWVPDQKGVQLASRCLLEAFRMLEHLLADTLVRGLQ